MLRTLSLSFVLAGIFFVVSVANSMAATLTYTDNLVLWLRADQGAFSDAGTTAATNGSTIQQWNDQLTGSNVTADNATQATAGNRPLYVTNAINGMPALRFDAGTTSTVGDYMDGASVVSGTSARTIFMVASSTDSSSVYSMFELNRDASATPGTLYRMTPEIAVRMNSGFRVFDTAITTSPSIATFRNADGATSSDVQAWLNGNALGESSTLSVAMNTGTSGYRIAGSQNLQANADFDGDIAEILVFDSELNAEQLNQVGFYLASKYGLDTAFVAPPVPEPATCTLLGLGLVMLQVRRRRARRTVQG